MSVDMDRFSSVTVTDGSSVLLGIGVGELVTVAVIDRYRFISVSDNVVLSLLRMAGDAVTVTDNGHSVSIVTAGTLSISRSSDVAASDDGHGVALQGSAGALILISASSNVGLSKLISVSEAVAATDAGMSLSFVSVGTVQINRGEDITVEEQAWLAPYDSIPVSEYVELYFRTICPFSSSDVAVDDSEMRVFIQAAAPQTTLSIFKDDSVLIDEGGYVPGIPPMPSAFSVAFVSGLEVIVAIPLMPSKAETVTVDGETVTLKQPFLALTAQDIVTIDELFPLQFSVLFVSVDESLSVVDDGGISRPPTTWEPAAESDSSWDTERAAADTWQPGAAESTVWA